MFKKTSLWTKGWSFHNDDAAAAKAAADAAAAKAAADAAASAGKTFTQDQLNAILAEDRRKSQAKTAELTKELEKLQQNTRLTAEERQALAEQLESLKNESLTKEQQLTRDLEAKEKALATTTETLTKERDTWQQKYGKLLVDNALTKAAVDNKALHVHQIMGVVGHKARVVEKKGADGKGTGEFDVLVKFEDVDPKTKEPVVVDLSPDATLKRMRELPDLFGNLFDSGVQGGLGRTKVTPSGEPDYANMSPEQYREARKQRQGKK